MLASFHHEEVVTVGEDALRLVINFLALDAIESAVGRGFDTILRDLTSSSARPAIGLQAQVLWGLLREHRPDITLDQAAALVIGPTNTAIGMALGRLLASAFPAGEQKAKDPHPRAPRGASSNSSSPGASKA